MALSTAPNPKMPRREKEMRRSQQRAQQGRSASKRRVWANVSNVKDIYASGDLDWGTACLKSGLARMARKKVEKTSGDNALTAFCYWGGAAKDTERNVRWRTNFCYSYFCFKDDSQRSMLSADGDDHGGKKWNNWNGTVAGVMPMIWWQGKGPSATGGAHHREVRALSMWVGEGRLDG